MAIAPLRKKYLGEILLTSGFITREQLRLALVEQQETHEKLGAILLKHKHITEDDLFKSLATCYGLQPILLADIQIETSLLSLIPEKMARKFGVIPVEKQGEGLKIAMSDPSNVVAIDEIENTIHMKLTVVLAHEADIKQAIDRHYAGGFTGTGQSDVNMDEVFTEADEDDALAKEETDAVDAAPVIKYVNALLIEAVTKKASDIHIEPEEKGVSLRMRLDGSLRDFPSPPLKFFSAIISRIKIIANLDIAERRLPQDGKCKLKVGNKKIDVRVSTLPTIYGEKIVMRVLDRGNLSLDLADMGLAPQDLVKLTESLERPYGMILVTGPTGSGKTTTLYTGLNFINKPDVNIITVEDPVEYELKKINQVQVRPTIGLTFASVLRSVLRQDPDIIMIGEIRDKETAEIAIQAALTGHLVLSTLHTNDAVSSLSRMAYMGIEPILIADAVDLVIAQRLIRRICPNCREVQEVPATVRARLQLPPDENITFYHGKGCDKCYNTGYKGRAAIMEMLKLSQEIKKMIITETSDISIKETAIAEGMKTLREQALDKLRQGITTVEEVLTVTSA
jgi:type IV pilus assembly protein PilB